MPAYLIADITRIHNPEIYADYRSRVSDGIEAAGGRYLARGGSVDVFEGEWQPGRIVIVRFESSAAARAWWASPGYHDIKRLRQAATDTNMIVVDGLGE
jgi:uncharacterized protein (DUF1330 family)